MSDMQQGRPSIECWLTDMDGVLVHENHAIPGAAELIEQWEAKGQPYLVLTNNSIFTARDLSARLASSGIRVPEDRIWTSALATAAFLKQQKPGGSAFVLGEAGILTALHDAGYVMTETNPDYVVVGETRNYSFDAITKAIRLINNGARFISTNPDATGPSPDGVLPATGRGGRADGGANPGETPLRPLSGAADLLVLRPAPGVCSRRARPPEDQCGPGEPFPPGILCPRAGYLTGSAAIAGRRFALRSQNAGTHGGRG